MIDRLKDKISIEQYSKPYAELKYHSAKSNVLHLILQQLLSELERHKEAIELLKRCSYLITNCPTLESNIDKYLAKEV
jgi:hypothetical protein